jgi:hypothetical protein
VKAASTVSSPPQKRFYETTPTRVAVGDVDEQEAPNYIARRFGTTASPFLLKYIYDDDVEYLDIKYRMRKVDNVYMIGNWYVTIDDARDIYVNDKRFRGTKGLWELLTRKKPNLVLITAQDYEKYKSILLMTSGHLEQYHAEGNIHVSRGPKYRNVISKQFPRQARVRRRASVVPGKLGIDY